MNRRFPRMSAKAEQVFRLLEASAKLRKTLTYGDVAKRTGGIALGVSATLNEILAWTNGRGIPPITILVVRGDTGRPGHGFQPNGHILTHGEFSDLAKTVFEYEWESLGLPSQGLNA